MSEPLRPAALIGVVHLAPLPGSPRAAGGDLDRTVDAAVRDAGRLAQAGFDALIVENFGDAPFVKEGVAPETIAALAIAVREVRGAAPIPVGVNVLRNDARAALGIAAATGARFIRVNVHVGAAVTDQGLIEGRAAETLRARAALGAAGEAIRILADVHVKHAKPLAEVPLEISLEETILRGLADAAIVTGATTGRAPAEADLRRAKGAMQHIASSLEAGRARPLLVLGSGLTAANAPALAPLVDAAIVGTSVKERGVTTDPVDPARARAMVEAWRSARSRQ